MTVGITNVQVDLSGVANFNALLPSLVDKGVGAATLVFEGAAKVGLGGSTADVGNGPRAGASAGQVWNKPSLPGQYPNRQSGDLYRRVGSERQSLGFWLMGTNYAVGRHMEFGSHPRAKKGKFLAIPLNYEAARLQRRHASLTEVEGLVILAKTKRGYILGYEAGSEHLVGGKKQGGKRRKSKGMFALVPDVVILPRPWLRPTMLNTANQREAAAAFAATIDTGIKAQAAARGAAL